MNDVSSQFNYYISLIEKTNRYQVSLDYVNFFVDVQITFRNSMINVCMLCLNYVCLLCYVHIFFYEIKNASANKYFLTCKGSLNYCVFS